MITHPQLVSTISRPRARPSRHTSVSPCLPSRQVLSSNSRSLQVYYELSINPLGSFKEILEHTL